MCYRHPTEVATSVCDKCNRPICEKDYRNFNKGVEGALKTLCPKCFDTLQMKGDKKLVIAFSVVLVLSLLTAVPLFFL